MYISNEGMSPVKNTKVLQLQQKLSCLPLSTVRPLAFATYSAVIGTQVVTLAKITMLQVRSSIDGDNQFDNILTYLFVVGMVVTG